jgi:hypothetical protein
MDAMANATPPTVSSNVRNSAHRGPAFLPWHREFLRRFEQDLRAEVPGVALPYWDWASDAALADPTTGEVWGADLMGGDGDPADNDYVKTGPFAYDPADPNTWTIADEDGNDTGDGLQRNLGGNPTPLPSQADVDTAQAAVPYDAAPWNTSSAGYRNLNEGWAEVNGKPPSNLHNRVHIWVGGSMMPGTSPNDPVFFLHHCFVDKMWADWQAQHPGEAFVPGDGASADLEGHRLNDPMYPWSASPADVLDHHDLGYMYDTDAPVVEPETASLVFNDVPEGETTVRAAVFEVSACEAVHLEVVSGPTVLTGVAGTSFGTPLGATVTVLTGGGAGPVKGRVWISYTGTSDGDTATGTVTIGCPETGEEWVLPISANTIARPTVATVLVLDKSGSMTADAGDGRQRIEVLKEAAPIFVDLLREDDGIGIVSFDQDATLEMPVTPAGPLVFGAGRTNAKAEISAHAANPAGFTSIGDGVQAAHTELGGVSGYDEEAIVVLTDGRENRSLYIADVAGLIDDRVFGIGLGTAAQIEPAALTALTNGTGGYVLMTGTLDTDDYFILSKYYLQILAGVTNADVVLDPEGWLAPGQKQRIPFRLNEADISSDVVLLTAGEPNAVRFWLETPGGSQISPSAAAALPGAAFGRSNRALFYRLTLPVPIGGGAGERAGVWQAVLEIDEKYYRRYLASLENDPEARRRAEVHGVRYSLNVHSFSNLRMRGRLVQDSLEPGARLTLRAGLTEYGLPVAGRAEVQAELVRPDGTTARLSLDEVEAGAFQADTKAAMPGIYRFRLLARGRTLRNRPFTREQLVGGAVWPGGDNPPPTSDGDPRAQDERLCRLLGCLLADEGLRRLLEARGIEVDHLHKCLVDYCRDRRPGEGAPALSRPPELGGLVRRLTADPQIVAVLARLLAEGEPGR